MTWSTGELGTLAMRAVRGAGQSWGVAEEAAWAIRWLIRSGLAGPEALARALETKDLGELLDGIAIADQGEAPDLLRPATTVLLLPFIGRTAEPGQAHLYTDGAEKFRIWAAGGDALPNRSRLKLHGAVPIPEHRRRTRADLPAPAYQVLSGFAARTYAPATEASRLLGAGAGLTDND